MRRSEANGFMVSNTKKGAMIVCLTNNFSLINNGGLQTKLNLQWRTSHRASKSVPTRGRRLRRV